MTWGIGKVQEQRKPETTLREMLENALSLPLHDYIDRDLHSWNRSFVLKPV
jgi:hypothetical protein